MNRHRHRILDSIGHTPLAGLRRLVPQGGARVLVKVEGQNPTGSMKDRMARAVVEGALMSGRLQRGGRLVEYTGGSTGTSLAFVCAAMGVSLTVVTSDAFSQAKRDHMRALGAEVIEIPSEGGRTTKALIEAMIARATDIASEPGNLLADQFHNLDAAAGYVDLAREILEETEGRIDVFVQSVGTAQCLRGVGMVLREEVPGIRVVAVEPAESAILSGGQPGPHDIEGVGPGFVPPLWREDLADSIHTVSTQEAVAMAGRLAREEGLFAGISSGGNVAAALAVAGSLGPQRTVVTLLCDTGLKYLS